MHKTMKVNGWTLPRKEQKILKKIFINKQRKECCQTWTRFWLQYIKKFKCDEIEFNRCGGCGNKIKGLTEKDLENWSDE